MSIIDEYHWDFANFLKEIGVTAEQMEAAKSSLGTILPSPQVSIKQSPIEGMGAFSKLRFSAGETIGSARFAGKWTELGRFTNHSPRPNAAPNDGDDLANIIVAIEDIAPGDEITIDYRAARRHWRAAA